MRGRHKGFTGDTQVVTAGYLEVEEGDTVDGSPCEECHQPFSPGDLVRESFSTAVSGYEHATCTGEPT